MEQRQVNKIPQGVSIIDDGIVFDRLKITPEEIENFVFSEFKVYFAPETDPKKMQIAVNNIKNVIRHIVSSKFILNEETISEEREKNNQNILSYSNISEENEDFVNDVKTLTNNIIYCDILSKNLIEVINNIQRRIKEQKIKEQCISHIL